MILIQDFFNTDIALNPSANTILNILFLQFNSLLYKTPQKCYLMTENAYYLVAS